MYAVLGMFSVILMMAAFDALLSAKRMERLGLQVELNPLARLAFVRFGRKGLVALIVGMSAALAGIAVSVSPLLLAGFVGFRAALLLLQLKSLQLDPPELP